MNNPQGVGEESRASLIEKLRQIADAKVGEPAPACLCGDKAWAIILAEIAKEAADALEQPLLPANLKQIVADSIREELAARGEIFIKDWQPIDTAPVDPADTAWSHYEFHCLLQNFAREVFEGYGAYRTVGGSRILRWYDARGRYLSHSVTHWMHLPAPCSQNSSEDARSKP